MQTSGENSDIFIVILPITSSQHYSRKSCSNAEDTPKSKYGQICPLVLLYTSKKSAIIDARSQLSASKVELLK